jgi:hypothetical protein
MAVGAPSALKARLVLTHPRRTVLGAGIDAESALYVNGISATVMIGRSFDASNTIARSCGTGPTGELRIWLVAGGGIGSEWRLFGGGSAPFGYGKVGFGLESRNRGTLGIGVEAGVAVRPSWGLEFRKQDVFLPFAQLTIMSYGERMEDR